MWFQKYKQVKDICKNEKLEEYKKNILRLANDIEEALEKGNDYILDKTIIKYDTDIAYKLGFTIEYHGWGNYIYFNKFGMWRLKRKLKKYNLESKGE